MVLCHGELVPDRRLFSLRIFVRHFFCISVPDQIETWSFGTGEELADFSHGQGPYQAGPLSPGAFHPTVRFHIRLCHLAEPQRWRNSSTPNPTHPVLSHDDLTLNYRLRSRSVTYVDTSARIRPLCDYYVV